MTWRQIETSREVRLWVREIIVPATLLVGTLYSIPESRTWMQKKVNDVKTKLHKKKEKES